MVSIAALPGYSAPIVGGSSGIDEETGSFTPTLTCTTPGDLAVTYNVQIGRFVRLGEVVFINIAVGGSFTYTTATGNLKIAGLPYNVSSDFSNANLMVSIEGNFTWPANSTVLYAGAIANNDYLQPRWYGSGRTAGAFTLTASWPSGASRNFRITGAYKRA